MTDPTPTPDPVARPRIRVAAIVWGLVLAGLGVFAVSLAASPVVLDDTAERMLQAAPSDYAVVALGLVLAVGVVITLGSVLAAVRRRQERSR